MAASKTAPEAPAEKNVKIPRRTVFLPRANPGEDNFVVVGVNGKTYKIQRGVSVEVPYFVAEVLDNTQRAEDRESLS